MAGILAAIGHTPLVELQRLRPQGGGHIFVKYEATNPTGSMKDRMALAMIEGARRSGRLKPGHPVVELTGGSTGSSLALVCGAYEHPLTLVTSDAVAREKTDMSRALGAKIELIKTPEGKVHPTLVAEMQARVEEIVRSTGAFWTEQFRNRDQLDGYTPLAEEVLQACPGVTHFVHIVGTAGSAMGTARRLRRANPRLRVSLVEPASSPWLTTGKGGVHGVEGTSGRASPPLLDRALYDDVLLVEEEEGREMARRLAREEGIFAGTSTGLNVVAARRIAERAGPDAAIVTIGVDSGLKYLGGSLFRG
ncbi:MAG: PLP-dependent cysteine synthase family protein [Thermoplasmatota archaeon]